MKFRFAFIVILAVLLLPAMSVARKGVGVVWDTEIEIVNEDSVHCVQYGIYNPWEEDVTALLSVSDELKEVIVSEKSEAKLINAGTTHKEAVPIEFCFQIANIYPEDCLVGNFICEQKCSDEEVSYSGKIVAMEKPGTSTGSGSATSLGVSVPLKLRVRCSPYPRDWTMVYIAVAVISIILIVLILRKRKAPAKTAAAKKKPAKKKRKRKK